MRISKSKVISAAIFSAMLVITFGCGGKSDTNPNTTAPAPVPTTPVPTTTTPTVGPVPGPVAGSCPVNNPGGTALVGNPYISTVSSYYNYGYATQDKIYLTLFTQNTNGYPGSGQRVAGTIGLVLSNLNQYQASTQSYSFCGNSSFSQPSFFDPYSGQVQATFQGANSYSSNPYYPAQQQQVVVYVGYECPARLIPTYGSSGSTIEGCFSVQIGNQQPIPYQATGRQY